MSVVSNPPAKEEDDKEHSPPARTSQTKFEELSDMCSELDISHEHMRAAWRMIERLYREHYREMVDVPDRPWLACALYVASCQETFQQEKSIPSLVTMLKCANVSVKEFLILLKRFSTMAQCGPGFDECTEVLERKFCVTSNLFNKFKKLFYDVFNSSDYQDHVFEDSLELTWLLFLLANGKVLGKAVDMVHSFHLLLCCVAFTVSRTPDERLSKERFPKLCGHSENDEMNGDDYRISNLSILCEYVGASFPEVKSMFDEHLAPFLVGEFGTRKELPSVSEFISTGHVVMNKALVALNRDYEEKGVFGNNDIDDRVFLSPNAEQQIGSVRKSDMEAETDKEADGAESVKAEFSKLPIGEAEDTWNRETTSASDASIDLLRTPLTGRKYVTQAMNRTASATNSTSSMGVPSTPVTNAVESVTRLKEILSNTKDTPSQRLVGFLNDCKSNPMKSMERRLKELCDIFQKEYVKSTSPNTSEIAVQLFVLGKKLYFRVLEAIIAGERERLHRIDFSPLLQRGSFHRSLLACALEIVMYSYKLSSTNFPWILGVLDLCPYEFFKIVETFIKHEPTLTRTLVKHFASLEEKILESMAWTVDSPIYKICDNEKNKVPGWVDVMPPDEMAVFQGNPSLTYGSPSTERTPLTTPHMTPVRQTSNVKTETEESAVPAAADGEKTPERAKNVPGINVTGASPRRKAVSADLFFRKVYNLANVRLADLCAKLSLDDELKQRIWTVFEWTVKNEFSIMVDRHLDQIVICALYAMSKVMGKEIQFRDIIGKYRTQPQAASHVYRSVLMTNSVEAKLLSEKDKAQLDLEKRDSIIAFYNAVYLPRLRSYILQFSPNSKQAQRPPLSPLPVLRKKTMSPRRVSNTQNFYVSPMRRKSSANSVSSGSLQISQASNGGNTSASMTPRTKALYSFGESPSKDLHQINRSVGRRVKRLNFDEPGDDEDKSKRQKLIQRKFQDLASDCAEVKVNGPKD
eukprot:Nk52_evm7s490 gene=Nk52_evmTU7s490